ncbi:MAG: hypothetical protein V4543_03575 [Bacteroidota bacterium]
MSLNNNKVALLVHTCDSYELLYQGFNRFFTEHWNFNIPCNYYFATENNPVRVPGFKTICSGKGEWADRLHHLLSHHIQEKYVLYFQEDMWLNKNVSRSFFEELFAAAEENNWMQVKLHSSEVYKTRPTDVFIEGINIAEVDNLASGFLMSHQVTLWNREFLLAQLKPGEHPWRNERLGTKRLKKLNPKILQADYFAENGKPPINKNEGNAARSEYQTISVNGVLSHNVRPYLSDLRGGSNAMRSYAARLEHNYLNGLTHNGGEKPRKDDIFKCIKNMVRAW